MNKIFNLILLIGVLSLLYYCIKQNRTENFVNLDKVYYIEKDNTQNIEFNYDNIRDIDKQFMKEQEKGVVLNTWYPNTWIEKIDEEGNPVYGSRELKEDFIESKARFTYEFNEPRVYKMDGVMDPNEIKNNNGKTLKEVYDNSFIDFKKLVPKKEVLSTDEMITQNGASNLSYIMPDVWMYKDEKPENGGVYDNGIMASDPYISNSISNMHSIVE